MDWDWDWDGSPGGRRYRAPYGANNDDSFCSTLHFHCSLWFGRSNSKEPERKCHHIFEIKRGHEDSKTKITTCVQFCRSTTLCFLILSSSECCDGYGGGNDENLMLINSVHYGESYYYCKWENNLSL